jgi:hypothetical protein
MLQNRGPDITLHSHHCIRRTYRICICKSEHRFQVEPERYTLIDRDIGSVVVERQSRMSIASPGAATHQTFVSLTLVMSLMWGRECTFLSGRL